MALRLNLRRSVIYPALWLDREEWMRDTSLRRVITVMNDNPHDALRDLGGFGALLKDCEWVEFSSMRDMTVEQVVDMHIANVLNDCGGNRLQAAARLGINPSTIYRRMVKLHAVDPDDPANGEDHEAQGTDA